MQLLWSFESSAGTFYIGFDGTRYHPIFKDDSLGSFARPDQAAEDLAGGHTDSPSGVRDTAKLGISPYLSEWTYIGPPQQV